MGLLLVALGIDNLGSGLFLPLTLVYATRVVGLPLAVAGVTVTVGTVFVRAPHIAVPETGRGRVSRRFLLLILLTGLVALGLDFFLVGIPVYVLDLGAPAWLPGVLLAVHTAVSSTCGTLAVRLTDRLRRTTTLALAAALIVVWCALCLVAAALPVGWRPVWLLATALVLAASGVLFGARVNALAVALAPPATRGRHLAAFQYAFTVAQVLAPAVVALFAVGVWVPWTVVAACASVGAVAFYMFRDANVVPGNLMPPRARA